MTQTVLKIVDLDASAQFHLSDTERDEIHHEMSHYPDPRAASIEALKVVQRHRGWVPDGAIAAIAAVIGIPAAELEGVATFYSLIFRHPVGRHVIKVCDSIACHLTGYDELRDALIASLGVRLGETTRDGRFTLLPICCLGACDRGACLMIDDDLHGPVEPAQIAGLLEPYT
ncbi:MAG: NADH-quinone oxidoreductase subunit NuoE [Proteobacteria bacterium]|nr:NADH-quinone oxidoreductase subunit NuoE [Pseudomonadota bacterium]